MQFNPMLNSSKGKRGRPQNPYTPNAFLGPQGSTCNWFNFDPDLAMVRERPAPAGKPIKEIQWETYGLIIMHPAPTLRRVLEAELVFDRGYEPQAVSKALSLIREGKYGSDIVCDILECDNEKADVYGQHNLTISERKYLYKYYKERKKVMTIKALKDAGEHFGTYILG